MSQISQDSNTLEILEVAVPTAVDTVFDYCAPESPPSTPAVGQLVCVPFRNKEVVGLVTRLKEHSNVPRPKLKRAALPEVPCQLQKKDVDFMMWMARYTVTPIGKIAGLLLPPAGFLKKIEAPTTYLKASHFSGLSTLTPRQTRLWEQLDPTPYPSLTAITKSLGCSLSLLKALRDKGALVSQRLDYSEGARTPDASSRTEITLNPEQHDAYATLCAHLEDKDFSCSLVHGVTGSGKTEVYAELIRDKIDQGYQVLILVPEITLTSELTTRLQDRIGLQPVLWHSGVSPQQRKKSFQKIYNGTEKLVLAARSGLFLPFQSLGLIVVDEEHDQSYKQEDQVIYNARDMAITRAFFWRIPIVLASATPSLESMHNARSGKYKYIKLTLRHGKAVMPKIQLVDMKDRRQKPGQWMSQELQSAIEDRLNRGEQSLLYLNRRGFAPLILCQGCGYRFQCVNCSAWLTEHRTHRELRCHHCNFSSPYPETCPDCENGAHLTACGPGVERMQEEVTARFHDARVLMLSSDTIKSQSDMAQAVQAINNYQYDILIGTQMIAKGHNFPNLTLVGIIDADLGLTGGDLRACEKTFQALQQVSGRSGRFDKPGDVIVQTFYPEHQVMQSIRKNDFDEFAQIELRNRLEARLPPFWRLAAIILSGPQNEELAAYARGMLTHLPPSDVVTVLGPAPAPFARLRGMYRWRFLVQAPRSTNLQAYITQWIRAVPKTASIRCVVDVDPLSFF